MQQDAISAKRSHDDAVALLSNPNTPLVVGGAALIGTGVFFSDTIIDKVLEALEDAGEIISDAGKATIKTNSKNLLQGVLSSALLPFTAPNILAQKAFQTAGITSTAELKKLLGLK